MKDKTVYKIPLKDETIYKSCLYELVKQLIQIKGGRKEASDWLRNKIEWMKIKKNTELIAFELHLALKTLKA